MMIIIKHRGRLFSTLPRLGGTRLGPRAGVHGGGGRGKQKTKEEGQGDSWGGGNRSNERLEGNKRQIGGRQR